MSIFYLQRIRLPYHVENLEYTSWQRALHHYRVTSTYQCAVALVFLLGRLWVETSRQYTG